MPAAPTVTGLLLAQASSSRPGLCFEDRRWSWQEHVSECARYAAALRARRRPDRPFQVGVLADNLPEFSFLLGGCAFAGAAIALRRRFSASGFLPDVRAFGATYANYVGKPLSYVLATPVRADDADNPLRIAYGNEGAASDLARFAERFGCHVIDGFGSTEGGVAVTRTPDTPPGALGKLADGVAVLNRETGRQCPPASFGPGGELLNPAEAVGEFVNTRGAGLFAGYYHDAEADASRMRDGMYWSGDLGYADSRGFCWFAGRAAGWLRIDGENLGTAPVERVLQRHPAISEAAQAASTFRQGREPATADGHVQGAHPRAGRRPVEYARPGVVAPGRARALPGVRPARRGAGDRT